MPALFWTADLRVPSRRSLLLATFILCALVCTVVARAGDNSWTAIGPDGGSISKVVFHRTSPNVLYALAYGGFFRSADGGAHWQQTQAEITTFATDFVVDPTNNDRVYLVTWKLPARVLVSTDAGVTFSTLSLLPENAWTPSYIAISADGSTLYAFCNANVFRSTDSGRSWQQRTDAGTTTLLSREAHVDPTDANTVYFVRNDRLMVTRDGAGTWTDVTPPGSHAVYSFALDPADPNSLWAGTLGGLKHSSDRGASWTIERNSYAPAVGVDPRSPSTVYVAESDGSIYRRNGTTWTNITNDLGSFSPDLIVVSPHDSARVAVANNRGLWMTANTGSSWARRDGGLVSTTIWGFAVAGNRTYTKGNALTRLDHGSDTPIDIETENLAQILSARSSHIGALAPVPESSGGLIVGVINRIGRTLNDGATWAATGYVTTTEDRLVDLAATTTVPSVYYASSELTLKRSTDQGASWSDIVSGLPAGQAPGLIAIAPSNQSVLYAGPRKRFDAGFFGEGVYKSINGGDSWTPANSGIADQEVTTIAIHPTNSDIVYIGTNYSLMKTVDGGATWTELSWHTGRSTTVRVHAIAIDPRAPDTVYVAGDAWFSNEVARSTDGGATWIPLASPPTFFPWGPIGLAIDTTRQDTLRVGTERGGIRQMTLRPDLMADLEIQLNPRAPETPLLLPAEYNFTIRNRGPASAGVVNAAIQVPHFVSAVTATPSVGSCTVASYIINCTAPSLSANATITIALTLTPDAYGVFDVVGSVSADGVDPQVSNNTVRHSAVVDENVDLGIDIAGPASARSGDFIAYIATITNSGPSTAPAVRVSYVAEGMTRTAANVSGGICVNTENGFECQFGPLHPGMSATLIVSGTADAAGTHLSTASVTGEGTDSVATNNSAQVSTNITAPPEPQPTPQPTPQPPPSGGGGSSSGGGGGAFSPLMLLGLLATRLARRRPLPNRERTM